MRAMYRIQGMEQTDTADDSQNTDDSQTTGVDTNLHLKIMVQQVMMAIKSDQRADQAMIYDSEGNGRLISEADDGNWYDSDGNYYGSWEDIEACYGK